MQRLKQLFFSSPKNDALPDLSFSLNDDPAEASSLILAAATPIARKIADTTLRDEAIGELEACIQLLESAWKEAKSKVVKNHLGSNKLILALLIGCLGATVALLATFPLYSTGRANKEQEEYKEKVKASAAALADSLKSYCYEVNTAICNSLTQFGETIKNWWWSKVYDPYFVPDPGKGQYCYLGSCVTWTYGTYDKKGAGDCNLASVEPLYYVTKEFPAIKSGDYCSLHRSNPAYSPFSDCNTILENMCNLTMSMGLLLSNMSEPDHAHYAGVLAQEQQLSQFYARLNYAQAESQVKWPSALGAIGAFGFGVAAFSLMGYYAYLLKMQNGCLEKIRAVDDIHLVPLKEDELKRIENLATIYGASTSNQNASTLIEIFKARLEELKAAKAAEARRAGSLFQEMEDENDDDEYKAQLREVATPI
jgi:hypothetical protein